MQHTAPGPAAPVTVHARGRELERAHPAPHFTMTSEQELCWRVNFLGDQSAKRSDICPERSQTLERTEPKEQKDPQCVERHNIWKTKVYYCLLDKQNMQFFHFYALVCALWIIVNYVPSWILCNAFVFMAQIKKMYQNSKMNQFAQLLLLVLHRCMFSLSLITCCCSSVCPPWLQEAESECWQINVWN